MILAPLTAVTLMLGVAVTPLVEPKGATADLTIQQKNTAMQPLLRATTECIARSVTGNPRYHALAGDDDNIGDLIVESMHDCLGKVQTMIAAYDRYFGDGSGEAFFMGPYLDVLPTAVNKWVANSTEIASPAGH